MSRSSTAARSERSTSRAASTPASTSTTATTTVIHSVRRPRRLRIASGLQHEADAAHGVQDARLPSGLELAPQIAHEDVGDVGPGIERVAPDLLVHVASREYLAGPADEEREQLQLAPRELEVAPGARGTGGAGVDHEVAH